MVRKASVGWVLIVTFDWPVKDSNNILIDTQSALNQESVNSPEPRVDWLICIAWKVLDSQLTASRSSVDWVSTDVSMDLNWVLIEGWLQVLIDGIDPGVD